MKEIIITSILEMLIIIITSLIYTLLGFKDLSVFINKYLIYILLIYYILVIIYLYKKNKRKETKINNYFPYILLGISIATIYNMIVFKTYPIIEKSNTNLILLIISSGIIGPIYEEILFRYIFYNRLKNKYQSNLSILINSIVFGIIHITPIKIIYAFLLGIILNFTYEKSKNIKVPILIHMAGNIIVIFLVEYNLLILILAIIILIISIIIIKQSLLPKK